MLQKGRQTWFFDPRPTIFATGTVVGRTEGEGPLGADFDFIQKDNHAGKDSFEKAEQAMLEQACSFALTKSGIAPKDIDFFIAGDLLNQITASGYTARNFKAPYLGIFAACATSMEGLALASLLISSGMAKNVLTATSSHNCTAERQFRYPNEYGFQRPPSSQYTASAAGAAVILPQGGPVSIDSATIGKVVDLKNCDPVNMGKAMAPAAADTILTHMQERGVSASDYDLICTGDLGEIGRDIAWDLLSREGFTYDKTRFVDCGMMLYQGNKKVFAGGSGCGCCASVGYGHIYKKIASSELGKVLLVATGALFSPISLQQCESIATIAHAVALERS